MEVKTNKTLPDQLEIKRCNRLAIEVSKAVRKIAQIKATTLQLSNYFSIEAVLSSKPLTSLMAIEVQAENSLRCFSQTCK